MPRATAATMLRSRPMVTFIAIECLDITATLIAAWVLLRMVVARPAIRASTRLVIDEPASEKAVDLPSIDLDGGQPSEDGITWPEPTWRRLAA